MNRYRPRHRRNGCLYEILAVIGGLIIGFILLAAIGAAFLYFMHWL
jgi:hypothetical protein